MAELIYGKNTVLETIKSNHRVIELYLTKNHVNTEKEIVEWANKRAIPIKVMEKEKMNQMFKGNHQGIAAKIEDYQYYSLEEILATATERNEKPFIIILDGLEDPHNLGAILRTAEATGVHGIIIPKNRSVSLNHTVAKLSTGAIEYVKVCRVTNITQTIKELKTLGVWVIGTDLNTNADYTAVDYKDAVAIVIGNEGKGISRLVKENCDTLVKIPMKGKIQSLNASVSAGVFMYEVFNQRRK